MTTTTTTPAFQVTKTGAQAIKAFFGCSIAEMKALTSADRAQLASGIADGSLTY